MNIERINHILAILTIMGHIGLILGSIMLIGLKNGMKNPFVTFFNWIGKNANLLGWITALVGILASLYYSEIIAYEPCFLCWWQRIFLYPQFFIFFIAWLKKNQNVRSYAITLSTLGLIVAIYNDFLQFGGSPFIPCSATGPSCGQRLIFEFGYVTMPMMSATLFAGIIFLMLVQKKFTKE